MKLLRTDLPAAVLRVAPALSMVEMPEEYKSTCANCAMAPRDAAHADHQRTFTAAERCCTYNPYLPNFVVGRILRRGDDGARAMLARLRTLDDGVSGSGVGPASATSGYYSQNLEQFGRFTNYRCPYWRGGVEACSIWRDRNAVCRTWHCKYVHAATGMQRWSQLCEALSSVEGALQRWCVERGVPPGAGAASDEWVAWFLACAERVAKAEDSALLALADESLRARLAPLMVPIAQRSLPDLLMASIREWTVFTEHIELCGYSTFDALEAPPGVFAFLSRFDGRKTWQQVLREWEAEAGEGRPFTVDRAFVESMFQIGVLSEPSEHEVEAQPGYQVRFVPEASRPKD